MNKAELIDVLTQKLNTDRRQATAAVENVVDTIVRAVHKGDSVTITGFGVFEQRRRAARVARNPRTGETVKVKPTSVPAFRPGAQFKAVVSGAQRLPSEGPAVKRGAWRGVRPRRPPRRRLPPRRLRPRRLPPRRPRPRRLRPSKAAAKKAPAKKAAAKKAPARKAAAEEGSGQEGCGEEGSGPQGCGEEGSGPEDRGQEGSGPQDCRQEDDRASRSQVGGARSRHEYPSGGSAAPGGYSCARTLSGGRKRRAAAVRLGPHVGGQRAADVIGGHQPSV